MKMFLTIFILAAGLTFISIKSESTLAKPPLERTGAPGETYCTDCHTGTAVNGGGGSMSIVFSGQNNKYKPGKAYTITISVTDPAQSARGGFETTILDTSNHPAGTNAISNPDNTMLRLDPHNGRFYVTNFQGPPYETWTFKWKAPATYIGPITIYCATNASNDDFTPMHDHIYAKTLTLTQKNVMRDGEIAEADDEFLVYPTLVHQNLTAKYSLDEPAHVQVMLYNLQGQLQEILSDDQKDSGAFETSYTLNKNYTAGIYLLALTVDGETELQKIVIQ